MKVEVYGLAFLKNKLERLIEKSLKKYPIAEAKIYLSNNINKQCIDCIYFPCNEVCEVKKK
ncbi:MAG: hypothetical protein QXG39_00140 [Candidatus Aenigmatarchaeota archaeon]